MLGKHVTPVWLVEIVLVQFKIDNCFQNTGNHKRIHYYAGHLFCNDYQFLFNNSVLSMFKGH